MGLGSQNYRWPWSENIVSVGQMKQPRALSINLVLCKNRPKMRKKECLSLELHGPRREVWNRLMFRLRCTQPLLDPTSSAWHTQHRYWKMGTLFRPWTEVGGKAIEFGEWERPGSSSQFSWMTRMVGDQLT
jgi:hypothetical protein